MRFGETRFLFREAIEQIGDDLLGSVVMEREGGWNILCKFFDNLGPIPRSLTSNGRVCQKGGTKRQTQGIYFPPRYNIQKKMRFLRFMGLEQVRRARISGSMSRSLDQGNNGLLVPLEAYRLESGTGWKWTRQSCTLPGSFGSLTSLR